MKLLGLLGWSGSGKTHLLTRLIPLFAARGLSVSTVKHAHHGFDLDQPGKDSFAHREAGAREVLIASAARWALMHEVSGPEPDLLALVARMAPVDLVLVEGFKAGAHPKIEVYRPSLGLAPFWPERGDVVAVATEPGADTGGLPWLDLSVPAAVADWVAGFLGFDDAVQPEA